MKAVLKIYPENKPILRGNCYDMPRPCPFIHCKHHTATEVVRNGQLKFSRLAISLQDLHPLSNHWLVRMPETCTLDRAEQGRATLDEIGLIFGFSHQRADAITKKALRKLRRKGYRPIFFAGKWYFERIER